MDARPTTARTPAEWLAETRLAAELDAAERAVLAREVTVRELAHGEVLVAEGASDGHLYVVLEGELDVVRHAGTRETLVLHTLTAGDYVSELSFLDDTPHYAALVANGRTRVLGLERQKLEALLAREPRIVYKIMRSIVRTVHQIQRRLSMHAAELSNYIYKQHGRY